MRPWKLISIVSLIVAGILLAKAAVHLSGLEFIALTSLVTALIGGVIFTLSILYGGTLPDYKESERIPGEMALSVKTLHKDSVLFTPKDGKMQQQIQGHVKGLLDAIINSFRKGTWSQTAINREIDRIDEDIASLAGKGIQPGYILKMRNELYNLERLSNRVETIKETSFMPAAYTVARLMVAMVMGIMIFLKYDPFPEGMIITGILGFLLAGLVYLIRDIDDPFERSEGSFADVDLEHIFKVRKYLEGNQGK